MSETPTPPPGGLLPATPLKQTSGLAIAALVVGCVCLFVCPLGGIAAIILGRSARTEIRNSQGRLSGDGLAVAGEVLGWVEIAITVVVVLIIILLIFVIGTNAPFFVNQIHNALVTPSP